MSRFFSQSIWKATAPPYGQDWGKKSGRFSNGRLVLDFITFRLGLPSLFAYHRKPLVSKQGTSFATAAAGARNWVYAGKTRSLQTQIAYMQEYKDKRKNNPQVMLDQSLIMISAGTNDYVLALLGQSDGQSVEQVLSATTGAIVKAVQVSQEKSTGFNGSQRESMVVSGRQWESSGCCGRGARRAG
ncbi:unnamed protein product [Closterium sp. NIES-54]